MVEQADEDSRWMQEALALAAAGQGFVEPNPLVGCVLVANGQKIGEGYHQRFGHWHAERNALEHAQTLGHTNLLSAATAYVTLEPCCHHGKTPPCTEALLASGVRRVVVAMQDPFAQVAGQGIEQLREAGIEVTTGVELQAAQRLNAPYLKRLRTGRPWVIGKWAMSLDGKIATRTGDSQWISGPESRTAVHELRGRVDAILVGRETVRADNPLLTARGIATPRRTALRIVADSAARIDPNCALVKSARETPVLIWAGPSDASIATEDAADDMPARIAALEDAGCRVMQSAERERARQLDALLRYLVDEYQTTNLLVEGGGQVLGSLLDAQQLDQCEVFIAPKLIGGQTARSPIAGLGLERLVNGPRTTHVQVAASGDDVHVHCLLDWNQAK